MTVPLHGGDVDGIARALGVAPADLLDFSANINPLGPPPPVRAAIHAFADGARITRYPEPGLPDLRAALASARGIAADAVAIGAGSAALFDAIVRASAAQRWAVPLPAFAEYRRAFEASDRTIVPYVLDEKSGFALDPQAFATFVEANACDGAIVTNPHNPTGALIPAGQLRALIGWLPRVTFVIDEAFVDFAEDQSLVADAARSEHLTVVRSLTKFYALPSMRVGYAVAAPAAIGRIERRLPAWPVSTIAADAACAALGSERYAAETLDLIAREKAALVSDLARMGIVPLPSAANFLCFRLPANAGAAKVRQKLLERYRIVIRDCSSFETMPPDRWVRVAVRDAAANARLVAALAAVLA
jgi:threonine-phosphate decarboxylase